MSTLFCFSIIAILYTYIGYPAILYLLALLKGSAITPQDINGIKVSVVIAARNEDRNLHRRITNLLEQDYPKDLLQIIIVSDGSTDKTNDIITKFSKDLSQATKIAPVLSPIIYEESGGKPHALNLGVAAASGDVVVFADSRQLFKPDAISNLVKNFSNPDIGCVSGELVFYQDNNSEIQAEMGAYWDYEKFVRKTESQSGSVVGATGAIYAIRRPLYRNLPEETILDDVLTPMNVVFQGFRVVFEKTALAYDVPSTNIKQERRRKVRTLAGNWQLLNLKPDLFSPFKNPIWWRFISHKMMRLLVPCFLVMALFSSAFQGTFFFKTCTILQAGFYGISIIAWLAPSTRQVRLINLVYFFMSLNVSATIAFIKWKTGKCDSLWKVTAAQHEEKAF